MGTSEAEVRLGFQYFLDHCASWWIDASPDVCITSLCPRNAPRQAYMYRALAEISAANCLKDMPAEASTAVQVVKLLCSYRTAADPSAKVCERLLSFLVGVIHLLCAWLHATHVRFAFGRRLCSTRCESGCRTSKSASCRCCSCLLRRSSSRKRTTRRRCGSLRRTSTTIWKSGCCVCVCMCMCVCVLSVCVCVRFHFALYRTAVPRQR